MTTLPQHHFRRSARPQTDDVLRKVLSRKQGQVIECLDFIRCSSDPRAASSSSG